jgi:hypothetical protein
MNSTPRHARPRRTIRHRFAEWLNREPIDLDELDGVGSRWTPADDLAILTDWRDLVSAQVQQIRPDAFADDPDRTTRREAFTGR